MSANRKVLGDNVRAFTHDPASLTGTRRAWVQSASQRERNKADVQKLNKSAVKRLADGGGPEIRIADYCALHVARLAIDPGRELHRSRSHG